MSWTAGNIQQPSAKLIKLSHFMTKDRPAALAWYHSDTIVTKNVCQIKIDGVSLKILESNIKTSMSQQNGKIFFSVKKTKNLWKQKISSVLTPRILYWLQYCSFPKIARRSGAFLVYRGPCAVSREGYRAWHRLAMVERTWGQCMECPISLPKGHRVQHCQHPGSHHYL